MAGDEVALAKFPRNFGGTRKYSVNKHHIDYQSIQNGIMLLISSQEHPRLYQEDYSL
jgi:hypothetical protein